MGPDGARVCLQAGANDLGGTLMDETITRSAGASHGQEMLPKTMEEMICSVGRVPRQRTTTYGDAPAERLRQSFIVMPLRRERGPPRAGVHCPLGQQPRNGAWAKLFFRA